MKEIHVFSDRYNDRKSAVMSALRSYELEQTLTCAKKMCLSTRMLISAAIIAAVSVSAFAAAKWIEFRVERDGDRVNVHAGVNETVNVEERPHISWRPDDGEISVKLNIPDLPADMSPNMTANGKYGGADSSRSLTFSVVDLHRSDIDQITAGVIDVERFDADGREVCVIKTGEANYYNRTAYMFFEREAIVLKIWVSYGVTDEELTAMLTSLTLEQTDDPFEAVPVLNELTDANDAPDIFERESTTQYVSELSYIGESIRDTNERFTATVKSVEVFDDAKTLDFKHVIYKDMFYRFVNADGTLRPFERTMVNTIFNDDGSFVKEFGESVKMKKKLYVVTLAVTDLNFSDLNEADRLDMLQACINGFDLDGYTNDGDEIKITSFNAVADRKLGQYTGNGEMVYRQALGDGLWKVAFLIDEDIAAGDMVLHSYTSKIYVKIK